jgi:hypothetical protein
MEYPWRRWHRSFDLEAPIPSKHCYKISKSSKQAAEMSKIALNCVSRKAMLSVQTISASLRVQRSQKWM